MHIYIYISHTHIYIYIYLYHTYMHKNICYVIYIYITYIYIYHTYVIYIYMIIHAYIVLTYRIKWCFVSTAKEFNSQRDVVHLGRLTVARTRSQTLSKISWGIRNTYWNSMGSASLPVCGNLNLFYLYFGRNMSFIKQWYPVCNHCIKGMSMWNYIFDDGMDWDIIEILTGGTVAICRTAGRILPWWCNDLNFCQCWVPSRPSHCHLVAVVTWQMLLDLSTVFSPSAWCCPFCRATSE